MFSKSILVLVITLVLSSQAFALRDQPFFNSTRAQSMGNAYTAYGDGFEAVFYNPAALAKKNKSEFKFMDLEGFGSPAVGSLFKDFATNLGNLPTTLGTIAANPGVPYSVGMNFLPQYIVKNFSIGLLTRSYFEGVVDAETTDMQFFAANDMALYAHVAFAMWGGILKFGIGAKAIDRAEINTTYTEAEYTSGSLSFENQWQEGIGYGFDAGILFTAPIVYLPALGISVTDYGNTTFLDRRILFSGSSGQPGAPLPIRQRINVGISIQPKHARGVKSVFTVEARDAENITSANYKEHSHLGWELKLKELLKIRAGYSEWRYWTAGFGVHVAGVVIEFASYAENIATDGGRLDDRKYVGRYVLKF